jgi:hypothetical protein
MQGAIMSMAIDGDIAYSDTLGNDNDPTRKDMLGRMPLQ